MLEKELGVEEELGTDVPQLLCYVIGRCIWNEIK